MKTVLACTVLLAGCVHNGTLATQHGNQLILGKLGIPEFPGQANRCPDGATEGEILKSWDTGKKRIHGNCRGGLMVGEWKAFYENGATDWVATSPRT